MRSNTAAQISTIAAKPILKWAGGKTQMLENCFQRFLLPMDVTLNLFSEAVPCFLHFSPKMLSLQIVTPS